jgi:hypothetical protein
VSIHIPSLPPIADNERTPLVEALLGVITMQQEQLTRQAEQIALQQEEIRGLKDEIARLKGHKPKPQIRPSRLEQHQKTSVSQRGTTKRSKLGTIEIHETIKVAPKQEVPKGSRFKGYADFTVVGLRFESHNIRYRLEVWETPDGRRLHGELPASQQALGGHFSPELVSFIRHQHHHALVPQGLIWEQLCDIGVPVSQGQVSRMLVEVSDAFHEEKEGLLKVGLAVSSHIHVDDTGARHAGKNGICTHIGNEWFAYFASTESKSRINFLKLLRAGGTSYVLGDEAYAYMREHKLPKEVMQRLMAEVGSRTFCDEAGFEKMLRDLHISNERHVRIVTEGSLLGSVVSQGIHPQLCIISDDAGQFNVLLHALCWIHAERTLAKLIGFSDEQRQALEVRRTEVWEYYRALKTYKAAPSEQAKAALAVRFDEIFTSPTCFMSLNKALERLYKNKRELLLVLERPDLDLHNNESENDVREYVMRRKRSGSTRSDLGRQCRDTFASLKKTCRKLGISFWRYLFDRCSGSHTVAFLPDLVRQHALEGSS